MNVFYLYLILLFPILMIFTVILLTMNKYRGYVEEEPIREVRLVSPALKIVKLLFSKTISSIEIIIIVVSLYLLTIMASSIAFYTYSMKTVDLENRPYLFDVAGVSNTISTIDKVLQSRYSIVIVQVYRALIFSIGNETLMLYPLLIGCNKDVVLLDNTNMHIRMLLDLCAILEVDSVVVLNKDLSILIQEVSLRNVKYNFVVVADLKPLLDVELIPGVYILHSIGSIGGETIKLEDINRVALLKISKDNIDVLCKDGCDAKIISLYIGGVHEKADGLDSIIDEYKDIFDYIIVRHHNRGTIYSGTVIPTLESIVGLLILFLTSVILLLSISSGLIEKLGYMVDKLWSIGISKEVYWASSVLTLIIIFSITAIPIAISCYIGWLNPFGLIAYLMVSITTIIILSSQLTRKLGTVSNLPQRFNVTYMTESYVDVEKLRKCLAQSLHSDDFFHLSEIEVLENSKYFVLRLEMMYRRALSTIASSEIYVEGHDNLWKYMIEIDVWSIEEFTPREMRYIKSLALSKVYGGLTSCLEKSS